MAADRSFNAGPLDSFPARGMRVVQAGRREVVIVRTGDDRVYAVLNRCPHRGAPLSAGVLSGTLLPSDPDTLCYGLEDEVLRCPWHGYEFHLTDGACLFTGQDLKARTFPVEIRQGDVHVLGL